MYSAYVGSNVTLVAYTIISANPPPFICAWIDNNNKNITTADGMLYNSSSLFIGNVSLENEGTYTYGCVNGDSLFTVKEITLIVITGTCIYYCIVLNYMFIGIPGAPLNFTVSNITNTTALLTWVPPINKGVPQFTFYKLAIISSITSTNQTVLLKYNSTVYTVTGLLPNTNYSASLNAADSSYPEGGNMTVLNFTTEFGSKPVLCNSKSVVVKNSYRFAIMHFNCRNSTHI